jgi:CubicO group peptidase (beta-lactamase class C family)
MVIDDSPTDLPVHELAKMLDQVPAKFRGLIQAAMDPNSLMNRSFGLTTEEIDFNDPTVQAAEIPSSNGIATARGLAGLYAGLLDGRILSAETLADATAEQSVGTDRVLMLPGRFASGFMLPTEDGPLGGPASFGHPGRGGSLGYANPANGVAFGYVVNHIVQNGNLDTRATDLVAAVDTAVNEA